MTSFRWMLPLLALTSSPAAVTMLPIEQCTLKTGLADLISKGWLPDISGAEELEGISFDGNSFAIGDKFRLEDVQSEPTVPIPAMDVADASCTLLMIDPDAPSRQDPKKGFWLHWMVVDIPCGYDKGETLSSLSQLRRLKSFNPSGPPTGSGYHRYIFLLFKQPAKTSLADFQVQENRWNFNLTDFMAENQLGNPSHATFYETTRDEETILQTGLADLVNQGLLPDISQSKVMDGISFDSFGVGEKFLLEEVQKEPMILIPAVQEPGAACTLMMVDSDQPSRQNPSHRHNLHWLVVDIPCSGSNEIPLDTSSPKSKALKSFLPSGPPAGSGYHRYIFLLFKQSSSLADVEAPELRRNFSVTKFAQDNKLGKPIYATFYETQKL